MNELYCICRGQLRIFRSGRMAGWARHRRGQTRMIDFPMLPEDLPFLTFFVADSAPVNQRNSSCVLPQLQVRHDVPKNTK
jgi:hypothetical protein